MRFRNAVGVAAATLAGLITVTGLTAPGPAQARGKDGAVTHTQAPFPARADGVAGHACSPYVSLDGYSDALDKTAFHGSYVGNLSALAPDADGRIAALSDRSELFGLHARTHRPERVIPLADEAGAVIDAEGLAVDRDGTYLVSSEFEPSVRRYARDGGLLGRLPVPDELRVAPAGQGRHNETFEGLTLSPDGRTLIAAMEGPLIGEGTDAQGRLVRLQTWQRVGAGFQLGRQFRYPLDAGLLVPEVHALTDGRLLVLERGFTKGVGNTVRLYLADPRRVSGSRAVPKRLLTDIGACPSLGAPAHMPQPNPLLDNIEGMAVTDRAPGGRLRVRLVSDDNESPKQITRLYDLTVRLPR